MLKTRQGILAKMLRYNNDSIDLDEFNDIRYVFDQQQSNEIILDTYVSLLNATTQSLINSDSMTSMSPSRQHRQLKTESKLVKNLLDLEHTLATLRQQVQQQSELNQLPNLKFTSSSSNAINTTTTSTSSGSNKLDHLSTSPQSHHHHPHVQTRANRPSLRTCQIVESNTEVISTSSIISTASSNGDLSEDEQINYYDDASTNQHSSNPDEFNEEGFGQTEEALTLTLVSTNNNNKNSVVNALPNNIRSLSTGSDQTVIVKANNNKLAAGLIEKKMESILVNTNNLIVDTGNDSSDDEVKEYNVFKDQLDEEGEEEEEDANEDEEEGIIGNNSHA